jgi:hypothetical protein
MSCTTVVLGNVAALRLMTGQLCPQAIVRAVLRRGPNLPRRIKGERLCSGFLECASQHAESVRADGHDNITNGDIEILSREYETECNQREPCANYVRSELRPSREHDDSGDYLNNADDVA